MNEIEVVSFGCRLNTYESEVIRAAAFQAGLEDAVIFNTCGVTAEALRQARQAIRRARRNRPGARLVVTGCAAQLEPRLFAAMGEVDCVLGNGEKLKPASYAGLAREAAPRISVAPAAELKLAPQPPVTGFAGHSRAFVGIQNGCDHRCTFCIIPFARGPSRSVAPAAIIEELRGLLEQGYREAVLTGVDLTAYGADVPGSPKLGGLVRHILKSLPELSRLRLSSIDSIEADADLFRAFAEEERLMPHAHLSLQSGDDIILKRMKRRHLSADAVAFCSRLRRLRPDVVFGADVIAGFPTESDAMFENTFRHVDACGLTYLHVFPFSSRPGTPAARMPQLAASLIAERAAALRAKARTLLADFLSREVGELRSVLTERGGRGHTQHHAPVRFIGPVAAKELLTARIKSSAADHLVAEAVG
ncbi:MAG TPA: tRNA (N(6)-L-threonylcarbamoyladenosine(37)-C(2))-methylthiotransferase MtaB [Aestuariivirgaceae bacterium]|nr:tRNA (N(6)-L-threonylcarbamoyladenosine(37)-C(2))-methylthiotransferase MtaB [Aestuariivirgaceae bacterium]